MNTMIKSIYLSAQEYGPARGKLTGSIEFVNEHGKLEVTIGNEQAGKIIAILADQLVKTASETATLMTQQVLEQARANGVELLA